MKVLFRLTWLLLLCFSQVHATTTQDEDAKAAKALLEKALAYYHSIGDSALIGEDVKAGRLVMPFELRVPTGMGYYLVYPPGTKPSAGLEALMDWLVSQAQLSQH
jgi:DNA-binding transcriptional LysR family regulator